MLFMLLYNYVRFYPIFPIFAKRAHASESGPSADVSAAAPKRPSPTPIVMSLMLYIVKKKSYYYIMSVHFVPFLAMNSRSL